MTLHAKDIMVTTYETIHVDAPIEEAISKITNGVVRETGYKTVSLMVTDDFNKLCGIISMFDILYHLRPDFLNFGIDGEELNWEGQLKNLVGRFKGKKVRHFLSSHVEGAHLEDHIMILLDRMVKRRYRRLPVIENEKLVGVVYISDIYHRLFAEKMI
jgi:CBS domain-containing protein